MAELYAKTLLGKLRCSGGSSKFVCGEKLHYRRFICFVLRQGTSVEYMAAKKKLKCPLRIKCLELQRKAAKVTFNGTPGALAEISSRGRGGLHVTEIVSQIP